MVSYGFRWKINYKWFAKSMQEGSPKCKPLYRPFPFQGRFLDKSSNLIHLPWGKRMKWIWKPIIN